MELGDLISSLPTDVSKPAMFFGLIDCKNPLKCIDLLSYIVFSLSIVLFLLTVIFIIFIIFITIKNNRITQSNSLYGEKSNSKSSNQNQINRKASRAPTRRLSIRSSSISLASDSEKSDQNNYPGNEELNSQKHWV